MDLVAYVKGDITTVTQIISQVVILTTSASFLTAIKASMLAGFLVGLVKGLADGAKLDLMPFFFPIIVFLLGIQPTFNLVITNDRTGAISRVDDVPAIIAGPTHLITMMGHGISSSMENALGLADKRITADNQALVSIRAPLAYEEVISDQKLFAPSAELPSGLSATTDAAQYVKTCVAYELRKGVREKAELLSEPVASILAPTTAASSFTGSNGTAYTCASAWAQLQTDLASTAFLEGMTDALDAHFGRYAGDTTIGARYRTALQTLVTDEAAFVANLVWWNALDLGLSKAYEDGGGGARAAAIDDALIQRLQNSRGTAEIVFETMSSIIGFIEAWSFAIMPIMILVMVFGTMGFKLASKYFWLLIWIQLWHPTILIVVDYMEARSLALASSNTVSITATRAFIEQSLRLEDTGYLMLSMATMLSMFLIYGSSAVFGTGLQRAISAGDHYNEKKVYGDTLDRAAQVRILPQFEGNLAHGSPLGVGRADFGIPRFVLDRAVGHTDSSSEAIRREMYARSGHDTSQGESRTVDQSTTLTEGQASRQTETASESEGVQVTEGRSMTTGNKASVDAVKLDSDTGSAGLTFGGGVTGQGSIGRDVGGSGVNVGGQLNGGFNTGITDADVASHRHSAGSDQGLNNNLGKAVTDRAETSTSSSVDQSLQQADQGRLGEQSSASERTTDSTGEGTTQSQDHSRSTADVVRRAAQQSVDAAAVSSRIADDPEMLAHLRQSANALGIAPYIESYMAQNRALLDDTFMTDAQKEAFSTLMVTQGFGPAMDVTSEQKEYINAVGDEFIEAASFMSDGVNFGVDGVDTAGLMNRPVVIPDSGFLAEQQKLGMQMRREDVLGMFSDAEFGPESLPQLQSLVGKMGRDGILSEDDADFVFSQYRDRLEGQTATMLGGDGAAERWREDGLRGLFGSFMPGGPNADGTDGADNGALKGAYQNDRGLPGIGRWTGDPERTLASRLETFAEVGGNLGDGPVARYMALAQLARGAENVTWADEGPAQWFRDRMTEMEASNPVLGNEAIASNIRNIAYDSVTPEGIADRLPLADHWYGYGQTLEHFAPYGGADGIDDDMAGLTADVRGALSDPNDPQSGMVGAFFSMSATSAGPSGAVGNLLDIINRAESPDGYEEISDLVAVSRYPDRPLTQMTVSEILAWQDSIDPYQMSEAVGRYQVMEDTLRGLVSQGIVDPDALFDQNTQDAIGVALLERRGLSDFLAGNISTEEFGERIAQEWAGLPVLAGANRGDSYYRGDGINKAHASPEEVEDALGALRGEAGIGAVDKFS